LSKSKKEGVMDEQSGKRKQKEVIGESKIEELVPE